MLSLNLQLTGEVEKFINRSSRLYGTSPESIACDLIAKGYEPEGKIKGVDISEAEPSILHGGFPAKDKPARSA